MAPRENENNAYAKFWGDKQKTLWYVTVFLEWSISVPSITRPQLSLQSENQLAVWVILDFFFDGFAKSPSVRPKYRMSAICICICPRSV